MLQRQYRLPARTRLLRPTTRACSLFVLKFGSNGLTYSRFGFVASKSIDKRAVVRNRTKRVLRSIIEEKLLNIQPGFDVLCLLRRPIESRSTELEKEVMTIFKRAKLISE